MINAIYFNAVIYSADWNDNFYEAMLIKDGVIASIGNNDAILALKDNSTKVFDMNGAFIMPGLIDAHLHPFWGASQSMSCDLQHKMLSKKEVIQNITRYYQDHNEDWLIVRGWLKHPQGGQLTRSDLDKISTQKPIIVFSNDCHSLVCNSLALASLKTTNIPENALNSGILEDEPAMLAFDEISRYSDKYALKIAKNAQYLLNQEGITTIMDARADDVTFRAFETLSESDSLTLRVFGAKEIPAKSFTSTDTTSNAIDETKRFITQFSHPQTAIKPTTSILHTKFFIDGVLEAPLHTALLREPYQNITPNNHYGDCYYDKALLTSLLAKTNELGWHPHMHTVGDAAIDFALNCIEDSQKTHPNNNIRPSLAHNEITAKDQYSRFYRLNVIATQSLQWAGNNHEAEESFTTLLGQDRFQNFGCAGRFYDAGVKVAYGSDWPIDHLDLWSNFQVGLNRQLIDDDFKHNNDRDLTVYEVLRSATIDAAYMLSQEENIGSLEVGKFADFIVLNSNPFMLPRNLIHTIDTTELFLGGKKINLR